MAKLDDVYESGAVPTAAYHAKRKELKNQIVSVVLQLNKSVGKRKGDRANRSSSGSEKRSSTT